MELPVQAEDETFGDYRKRNNFPHVYVPFFPGWDGCNSSEQVKWQVELQNKFPVIFLYPYDTLQVSKGNEMVVIIFEDESHITELSREVIVRNCSCYGREHAEKVVPSLEQLRERFRHNSHSI